jgi:hypothetical protein
MLTQSLAIGVLARVFAFWGAVALLQLGYVLRLRHNTTANVLPVRGGKNRDKMPIDARWQTAPQYWQYRLQGY